jgi:hypothetical protein
VTALKASFATAPSPSSDKPPSRRASSNSVTELTYEGRRPSSNSVAELTYEGRRPSSNSVTELSLERGEGLVPRVER